ncbi:MAG TPA: hypothetical protein VMZ91_03805 [Candidatus Paceibacterota bacterium]|nr:hypothetical protein [Candidatus Paceibacterota bacterium]
MKKIIVIFIIAFCLLCLLEISCLANEPSSPGEIWNTSSVMVKVVYVLGFQQGIGMTLNKLASTIEGFSDEGKAWIVALSGDGGKAWDELVDLSNFLDEHEPAILKIMDDLYKDPANTYIFIADICLLAYHKLKGENIEPLIQKARKEAL